MTGLRPGDRLMDLGCGPGMLAGAFAPLVREVVAADPEPEMLRLAEENFGSAGNIEFVRGSSFDLSPLLGRFRVVTMGRSFHWMDRDATLRVLDGMIEPDGAVALFHSETLHVPQNPWTADYSALVRRYAADDADHVRRRDHVWVRHEAYLLDSAFSEVDELAVIEHRPVTVEQLVHRAFSRSKTAPALLGDAAPRLAAEIEELLRPLAIDGRLRETIRTNALVVRRPR
jgi:SAM-dependent methyltransferase